MKPFKNHRVGIAAIAAFTLLAGGAQATHWPQAGADAGRSGNQVGDQATLPIKYRDVIGQATQTSPIITAGADLDDQRIVLTYFGTNETENRDGRVGLWNFATFVPVGTATDVDDEAPRDGLPSDQTVDPDQFGPAGDVVPFEASTHTDPTAGQVYVVHNDDNQSNSNPTAAPAQQTTPNPNGNDIAIAQIDGPTGALKRDQSLGSTTFNQGLTTNGMTVESAPVMGPDVGGSREVFFFASKTAGQPAVTTKHVVKITIATASASTSNPVTLNDISPNIADLNLRARPALVTFVDPDGGINVPMVAIPTTDGLKTIRAGDPGLDDFGPSISGLGTTWTPSVPVQTNGVPPSITPFLYVAASTGESTVVHKLKQGSGDAGVGTFVLAENDGQSPELTGRPSPALAVAQSIPTTGSNANQPQPGRVIVATSANIYSLNTENMAAEPFSLFDSPQEKGFSKTIPATSGNLGFAVTDGGQQQVFFLTPVNGELKVLAEEDAFLPTPASLNSTSSFGQPALSRGRVVFPANNGAFVYGPNVAILSPASNANVTGPVTLEAYVVNPAFNSVTFKVDGGVVGTDNTLDANRASVVWSSQTLKDGPHVVTAEASDGSTTEVSAQRVFIVNNFNNPTAALTVSPEPGNVGQDVTLNASGSAPTPGEQGETIVRYDYEIDGDNDFNDVAQNASIVKVQFTTPGTKTVRVRVTDSNGDTAIASKTFRVNAPPEFTLKVTPNPATAGQTVEIDATATDSDGSISEYAFDLDGDGAFELKNGTNPKVSKAFNTTTNVSARVTDNEGGQTIKTVTVTIPPANQAPIAAFIVAPNPATVGQDVGFSAAASKDPEGGPITKYEWDFDGNGTFEVNNGTNPLLAHRFATPGVFKVGLRVTDNAGLTGTTTVDVIVSAARCVVGNRCKPSLSASVSPKRDRKLPYVFTTRGRVRLPSGVTAADACNGRVLVQVKRGKKTISSRRVRVRSTCRFSSKVSFKDRKRLGTSKSLRFSIRFQGNKLLSPRSTSVKTVRIG